MRRLRWLVPSVLSVALLSLPLQAQEGPLAEWHRVMGPNGAVDSLRFPIAHNPPRPGRFRVQVGHQTLKATLTLQPHNGALLRLDAPLVGGLAPVQCAPAGGGSDFTLQRTAPGHFEPVDKQSGLPQIASEMTYVAAVGAAARSQLLLWAPVNTETLSVGLTGTRQADGNVHFTVPEGVLRCLAPATEVRGVLLLGADNLPQNFAAPGQPARDDSPLYPTTVDLSTLTDTVSTNASPHPGDQVPSRWMVYTVGALGGFVFFVLGLGIWTLLTRVKRLERLSLALLDAFQSTPTAPAPQLAQHGTELHEVLLLLHRLVQAVDSRPEPLPPPEAPTQQETPGPDSVNPPLMPMPALTMAIPSVPSHPKDSLDVDAILMGFTVSCTTQHPSAAQTALQKLLWTPTERYCVEVASDVLVVTERGNTASWVIPYPGKAYNLRRGTLRDLFALNLADSQLPFEQTPPQLHRPARVRRSEGRWDVVELGQLFVLAPGAI